MKRLPDITVVAVTTVPSELDAHASALEYSTRGLSFGHVLLLSPVNPRPGSDVFQHIVIDRFPTVGDWGRFIVFELHKYIQTEFIILIHSDGFIVNPNAWDDEFLQFDFIGAPWPVPRDNFSYRDYFGNIIRVGNSVSLRSRRLLTLPSLIGLDWASADHGFFHEDGFLCVQNRHILQRHGINYAPLSVACRFSREKAIPENRHLTPFAFHKWEGPNRHYPRFGERGSTSERLARLFRKAQQRLRLRLGSTH